MFSLTNILLFLNLVTLATLNKTFFTIITLHEFGKYCFSLSVVIQIFAFVEFARFLYLIE